MLNADIDRPRGALADMLGVEPDAPAPRALTTDYQQVSSVCSVFSGGDEAGPPPFPVESLTGPARLLVEEAARAIGCPPDPVAVPLLAITGGVIGDRVDVQLKQGFHQRAALWTAVVGDPGTAKTPAMGAVLSVLDGLQREAHERHALARAQHREALERWQAADRTERGPRPQEPAEEEHYYSTDCTIEGMARILGGAGASTPGFTFVRDELVGWVKSFDAYRGGKGGDRQTMLSVWAGASLKSDRAGRETIYVPHPVVSVCGAIQPDLLPSLAPEAGQRDGFIERFLFSFLPAKPLRWSSAGIHPGTTEALASAFRRIRSAPRGSTTFAPDAGARWARWNDDNAERQEHAQGTLVGYYAKLPLQLARIALVLHCLAHPDDPARVQIGTLTLEQAISVVEYFRAHGARVIQRVAGTPTLDPVARRLLKVLNSRSWASKADLFKALGGRVTARQLDHALDALGDAVQRRTHNDHKGGRPRQEYRLSDGTDGETEETEETSW